MIYFLLFVSVLLAVLIYDAWSKPGKELRDERGVALKPWASIEEISRARKAMKGTTKEEEIELEEAA